MISRQPEQRRYYQARLKWELDENTRLAAEAAAREASVRQGREEGRVEGRADERVRTIQTLRSLLNQPPIDEQTLAKLDLDQLGVMVSDLQAQIRNRMN